MPFIELSSPNPAYYSLEQQIAWVVQCKDTIQVRNHPEGEIIARAYSSALAQPEVGDKPCFLLGHHRDSLEDKYYEYEWFE